MGNDGDTLNFDKGQLENIAQGATRAFDLVRDGLLPGVSLLLFLAAVIFSVRLVRRAQETDFPASLRISHWPLGLKASLWPLLIAFAGTHIFSAGSVFYNTKIVNTSTETYFEAMGVGRLLSLSHAHLFAHAAMYFLLAVLVQFTSRGQAFRVWAPLLAMWAGIFDVVAWWGLKKISPNFEILSAASGALFSVGFLMMAFAILAETRKLGREV